MIELGVNIDHVATLRQARRIDEPDPVHAAMLAEWGGADGITVHLREDRRHIQERDLRLLRQTVHTWINLELAIDPEVVEIACDVRPQKACLVPERREELTTEGGLQVVGREEVIGPVLERLHAVGCEVSLFIDPEPDQVEAAAALGADAVELNTGGYSEARDGDEIVRCLERLDLAASAALMTDVALHAGHGLNLRNVRPVLNLPGLKGLHIGHSIVGRAVFVGMERAVAEMSAIIKGGREG